MILPFLTIAPSNEKGRGIFTSENIAKNTVIEISPVLVFSKKEKHFLEKTMLYNYLFEWGNTTKKRALGLGYVSIYNHNYNANCAYEMDFEQDTITITTIKKINAGEELFINYNAVPNDTTPIWFDAK